MTLTLLGRWQTRLFLSFVLGVPITLAYMLVFGAFDPGVPDSCFFMLPRMFASMVVLGLAWDVLFQLLQSMRWDRDWPLAFVVLGWVAEGALLWFLLTQDLIPDVHFNKDDDARFFAHFGSIFVASYAVMIGPMKVIFPRWRFRGGQLLGGR